MEYNVFSDTGDSTEPGHPFVPFVKHKVLTDSVGTLDFTSGVGTQSLYRHKELKERNFGVRGTDGTFTCHSEFTPVSIPCKNLFFSFRRYVYIPHYYC